MFMLARRALFLFRRRFITPILFAPEQKNHYDPAGSIDFSDSATQVDANNSLDNFRRDFKPLHKTQSTLMYFS